MTALSNHGGNVTPWQVVRKKLLYVLLATVILLLLPAIAMQFTKEVNWGVEDFAAAFVLLAGTGAAYALVSCRLTRPITRWTFGAALASALLLVWAELAVGILS